MQFVTVPSLGSQKDAELSTPQQSNEMAPATGSNKQGTSEAENMAQFDLIQV